MEHCTKLEFSNNKLTHLKSGMFNGLISLEWLNLYGNYIARIESGTFVKLLKLQTLLLENNQLTTLDQKAFQTSDKELTISLRENLFECDKKICWVKQAEEEGWIVRYKKSPAEPEEKLSCVNYPHDDWSDITINCTGKYIFFFFSNIFSCENEKFETFELNIIIIIIIFIYS